MPKQTAACAHCMPTACPLRAHCMPTACPLHALRTPGALWLPTILGTAFALLQLFWGQLLVKQLRKMMREAPPAKKAA